MIVEPTPTTPRSPIGRALRTAGLATPVLLLAVVAGFGLLGPRAELPAADPSARPSVAPAASGAAPTPPRAPDGPAPAFPVTAAGLRVQSVVEARPRLAEAAGAVVAVAGWLGSIATDEACVTGDGDTRGLLSPLCDRRARLMVADPAAADQAAHLHVLVPPGVRLPAPFEAPGAGSAAPIPVVIVGHADAPGSDCIGSNRGCGERFTADLVTWADGAAFDPGVLFDSGLLDPGPAIAYRNRDTAEAYAAGTTGTVLVAAVLRPATLASVDPAAAAALAGAPAPVDMVWYVRALVGAGGAPGMRWAVVDHFTGARLATGGAPPGDAFPAVVAGLPVRSVEATIAAYRDGTLPPVVAIAGYLRAWTDPAQCTRRIAGLTAGGCPRAGILALHTFSLSRASGSMDFGTHLHAFVPPGVVVPGPARGLAGTVDEPAPPVVVIARFGPPTDTCAGHTGPCEAFFALETVAWIAGERVAVGPQVAGGVAVARPDRVGADLDATMRRVFGPDFVRLRAIRSRSRDLVVVDRAVAAAVARRGGPARAMPIWYLRVLLPNGTIEAAVVTVAGRVVVRGSPG